jgi:FkbM family methyltransferase
LASFYSFLKNRALSYIPEPLLWPLKAWHYGRVLRGFDESDELDLTIVRKLVEPDSTVVDLGANIGIYTKILSELVGPEGCVISVEPVPQTFALLSRNVRSLGLGNVTCVNAAVSNVDGMVLMELPERDSGGTNFYRAKVSSRSDGATREAGQSVRVPARTLDTIVRGGRTVGFVKCDVEGHELACLTGAKQVLEAHRPAWLVELSDNPDDSNSTAWETLRLFGALSYSPWWFDGKRLMPRRPGDQSVNYFFLRPEHVAKLRDRAASLLK